MDISTVVSKSKNTILFLVIVVWKTYTAKLLSSLYRSFICNAFFVISTQSTAFSMCPDFLGFVFVLNSETYTLLKFHGMLKLFFCCHCFVAFHRE